MTEATRKALVELVALEDLKESTKFETGVSAENAYRMLQEYERRKPLAWANARATISEESAVPDEMFCLDTMNADNLRGYDYGCAVAQDALRLVLDGEDTGVGVCNEPWETLRRRVLALMGAAQESAAPQAARTEQIFGATNPINRLLDAYDCGHFADGALDDRGVPKWLRRDLRAACDALRVLNPPRRKMPCLVQAASPGVPAGPCDCERYQTCERCRPKEVPAPTERGSGWCTGCNPDNCMGCMTPAPEAVSDAEALLNGQRTRADLFDRSYPEGSVDDLMHMGRYEAQGVLNDIRALIDALRGEGR